MNTNKENMTPAPKKDKKPNKLIAFFKSRNAKRGSMAILLTVIFVAVIVGLNIVANLLTQRFPVLSTDLTAGDVYELTDTSVDYMSKLSDDVNVYVLVEEKTLEAQGEYYVQVNKLLHAFEQQSKHLTLKYVSLATNPTFTSAYPDVNWTGESYLLLVEHKDNYIAVAHEDVFSYDQETLSTYGEYVISGQTLEQALLTAILNVTTEEKVKITMLSGQGELDTASLASLLSNNAYEIETVSLLNGQISDDSQFVVIFAPTNDIDKDTYDTLVDWLYNDGEYGHTLLYVPNDLITTETPYIDTLLEEWGMAINKGWIYETDAQYMTNSMYPNLISIYNYDETEFASGLRDTTIPVVLMYCMPVELLDTSATSLLSSSENAVMMPLDADENWEYNEEEPQKLVGAAISSQGNEDETKSSNVIVFGSYGAFSESALKATSFNNSAYIINLFNTIAQRDDASLTVEGKSLDSSELGITSTATATVLAVLFRYIVPLLVVAVGIIMWLRRRHK
ncbi:MAG: hypothetical protein E7513_04120 [Ruminococcaceae bacterium]|nr:hypothetical protein [Oscillospiraceae bacterium]